MRLPWSAGDVPAGCNKNGGTPLAKSPDWLKAAPMRENMRTSWRQYGRKQDHCPSLLNHNAKYKRLLPPCCDFANGVWWFVIHEQRGSFDAEPDVRASLLQRPLPPH